RLLRKLRQAGGRLAHVVEGRLYRGLLTGLTEAFLINQSTRDWLVGADPTCSGLIKPALRGEDLRPWYQEAEDRWVIVIPSGWTRSFFGEGLSETTAWE